MEVEQLMQNCCICFDEFSEAQGILCSSSESSVLNGAYEICLYCMCLLWDLMRFYGSMVSSSFTHDCNWFGVQYLGGKPTGRAPLSDELNTWLQNSARVRSHTSFATHVCRAWLIAALKLQSILRSLEKLDVGPKELATLVSKYFQVLSEKKRVTVLQSLILQRKEVRFLVHFLLCEGFNMFQHVSTCLKGSN